MIATPMYTRMLGAVPTVSAEVGADVDVVAGELGALGQVL
jgi:hypothetical protein